MPTVTVRAQSRDFTSTWRVSSALSPCNTVSKIIWPDRRLWHKETNLGRIATIGVRLTTSWIEPIRLRLIHRGYHIPETHSRKLCRSRCNCHSFRSESDRHDRSRPVSYTHLTLPTSDLV